MADAILTLVCHAATRATRSAAFPLDEPLDEPGLAAAVRASGALRRVDAAWSSPALRARQTAEALGLDAAPDPMLDDLGCGAWAGRSLADVAAAEPSGLAAWLSDPRARPHGGETIEELRQRCSGWLDGMLRPKQRIVAVTHAAVLRVLVLAALDAPSASFWRIDAAPLCRARLCGGPGRWTLRSISQL